MSDNEFNLVLLGEGNDAVRCDGGHTRLRYLVADAFSTLAGEKQADGRPDRAGLLRHVASKLRYGGSPSNRVLFKARREVEVVRRRLVDGHSLSGK